ncbi:hypothetical protein BC831DRAFT_427311 [Entophlyctis helioformis]|nr:hypothetical protein BC831DRAFT_427311 [Entophlyctis helioformis]
MSGIGTSSALAGAGVGASGPGYIDYAYVLEEFIPTIENVPSEIQFMLNELSANDTEFHALRETIHANDMALRKLIKTGPTVGSKSSTAASATAQTVADGVPGTLPPADLASGSKDGDRSKTNGTSEPAGSAETAASAKTAADSTATAAPEPKFTQPDASASEGASATTAVPDQPPTVPVPVSVPAPSENAVVSETEKPADEPPKAQPQDQHSDNDERLRKLKQATKAQLMGIPDQLVLYERIQKDFASCKAVADEKVQLAEQMRDMLDRHLKRLMIELEKIEEQETLTTGLPPSQSLVASSSSYSLLSGSASLTGGGLGASTSGLLGPSLSAAVSGQPSAATPGTGFATPAPAETVQRFKRDLSFITESASPSVSLGIGANISSLVAGLSGSSAAGGPSSMGAAASGAAVTAAPVGGAAAGIGAGLPLGSAASVNASAAVSTPTPAAASGGGGGGSTTSSSQSSHKRKMSGSRPVLQQKRSHKRKSDVLSSMATGLARAATPEMDEQLYCFCQQVSYGEMIACDNEDCPHEWFHLECVGLAEPPTGVWFCKDCIQSHKIKKKARDLRH